MKRKTKVLISLFCAVLCAAMVIFSAPVSRAAGMMRLDIDDNTYTKVYTDTGALALVGWTYDASEDTLRLKNFGTAEKPKSPIFAYPYSGSMTIELNGDSYIKASGSLALTVIGHIKFTGTGSLTVISTDTYGINTDYTITVSESASLNVTGLAGIMALKGMTIDTNGSVNVHTSRKSINTEGDVRIKKGTVNLTGTVGIYTTEGNVYLSGGNTDVFITSTQRAIYTVNNEAFVEWSANAEVTAGDTVPGEYITSYNNELFFHASFSGIPKLNPPRRIYWDDTVIDEAGTTNPVGRWTAVEGATAYLVKLYYFNDLGVYELKKTFTVNDALSCNFGGHFTTYGKYSFSVTALGDGADFVDGDESAIVEEVYFFSGEIASRYYVTLPESDYFKIIPETNSTVVYYGESYSFTIEVDPAYTQSEVLVWANQQRVALRHGKYTIDNVTENLVIKVGELYVNTYSISFPTHEAYTVYLLPEYSTRVEYGGSCAFSIELSDIYMQSDLVVTANGKVLTPKYGIIYTISDITIDYTVEITGLVRDSYDITYKHIDGSDITAQTVDHGYTTTAPDAPQMAEGLSFAGWTLADGTLFDFNTPITEAVTLYARYEAPKQDGCYLISTLDQLEWFRNEVGFGNNAINGRLCADISMNDGEYIMVSGEPVFRETAEIWEPIGGYDYSDEDNYVKFYEGTFDGDGHTLSGFYIKHDKMAAEASDIGIFGIVSENGRVKNLNVTTSVFDGYGNIGSVVGTSYAPISGCTSDAILIGVEDVGGIAGEISADITDCSFNGSVKVEQYSSSSSAAPIGGTNAGGIAGRIIENSVSITDCTSFADVKSYRNAGGILGFTAVENIAFTNCHNHSTVYADENAGGILGCSDGTQASFSNITNNAPVSSLVSAGGIFAVADATVSDAVNNGEISGNQYAGAFGANGSLDITLSYNTADVVSLNGVAAGFIASGSLDAGFCYNIAVITGKTFAGGFAGTVDSVVLNQVHNFAEVKAEKADALAASYTTADVKDAHYRSEINSSTLGFASTTEWFYCGYTALLLNRGNDSNFWAQGEEYPVFATAELEGYVLPIKGDGSAQNPYILKTEYDLRVLSALINHESGWAGYSYKLGNDISVSEPEKVNNIIPFGNTGNKFSGTFDGCGYTLSGINISYDKNSVALFGDLTSTGVVKNTVFDNFTVNGKNYVAVITGYNNGTIYNCDVVNSDITGYGNVGAVTGYNYGDITYVNTDSVVRGTLAVGGIAGVNEAGNLRSCFNTGNVIGVDNSGTKSTEIGGVTGKNFALLSYCGNSGAVSGYDGVGGLAGSNYGDLLSLYNGGTVTATESFGGITGQQESESEAVRCYYISGTATGGLDVGEKQAEHNAYNGMSAYALNNNAKEKYWAQGEKHPKIAQEDGSDAVIYTVVYYSFGSPYYVAATKYGGAAITPPAPVVEGYNFLYWDTSYDNVTYNMTTRAVFDRDHAITFVPTASVQSYSTEYDTFLCGFSMTRKWTVADLSRQIANARIAYMNFDMYEEYGMDQPLFTGMSVVLYDHTGSYRDTMWVVIFGDIDGDGDADANDLVILNLICQEYIYIDELNYAQQQAADVNRDGVVDENDLVYMENFLLKENQINQYV